MNVITSAEDVHVFTLLVLLLSVKSCGPILVKFAKWLKLGPGMNRLDFGTVPDLDLDPG